MRKSINSLYLADLSQQHPLTHLRVNVLSLLHRDIRMQRSITHAHIIYQIYLDNAGCYIKWLNFSLLPCKYRWTFALCYHLFFQEKTLYFCFSIKFSLKVKEWTFIKLVDQCFIPSFTHWLLRYACRKFNPVAHLDSLPHFSYTLIREKTVDQCATDSCKQHSSGLEFCVFLLYKLPYQIYRAQCVRFYK